MDGFTGYATAVDEVLPQARKVMDSFHVVHCQAPGFVEGLEIGKLS